MRPKITCEWCPRNSERRLESFLRLLRSNHRGLLQRPADGRKSARFLINPPFTANIANIIVLSCHHIYVSWSKSCIVQAFCIPPAFSSFSSAPTAPGPTQDSFLRSLFNVIYLCRQLRKKTFSPDIKSLMAEYFASLCFNFPCSSISSFVLGVCIRIMIHDHPHFLHDLQQHQKH